MELHQFGIILCSLPAAWLVAYKEERTRRWAYIFGLCGQPFWLWASWSSGQLGILLMTFFYAAMWLRGFCNHWLSQPAPMAADCERLLVSFNGCARCGRDHKDVTFFKLLCAHQPTEPVYQYWACCPHTKEPVLLASTPLYGLAGEEV